MHSYPRKPSPDTQHTSPLPLRVFAMPRDTDPLARAQAASEPDARSSRKRNGGELKPYHAPWDTCPVHCLDLVSGRSAIDDKSAEDNWNYFKKPTAILAWRSECPLFVLLAVM